MENKKPLEILVVDDDQRYLDVAKEVARNEMIKSNYNIDFFDDFDESLEALDSKHYDRVITDLFYTENRGDWARKKDIPKGLLVYEKCIDKGIDVTILTDGDRHERNLGAIRYAMSSKETIEFNHMEKMATEGRRLLEKVGLDSEEKREKFGGDEFYMKALYLGNGHDKTDEYIWKRVFLEWKDRLSKPAY